MRGFVAFAAGLLTLGASVAAQFANDLASLTVPDDRLPAGCRLTPVTRAADGTTSFVMDPGIRDNPWLHPGPGSPHAASIRELIDRPAPSGDPRSGPAAHARNAVGVAEVYRAQYRGADGSTVEVYAVRFDDQQLTLRAVALTLDPRQRPRLVRGPTAVLVFRSGDWRTMTRAGEACHDAVRDHIASMK